jgi:hypothetical protein
MVWDCPNGDPGTREEFVFLAKLAIFLPSFVTGQLISGYLGLLICKMTELS